MDLLNDYLNSGAFTEKENIEVNESDLKNANIDVSSPIQKPIKETIIKEYSGNNIPVVPANPTPATPSYNFGSSMPEFKGVGSATNFGDVFGANTNFDANGNAIGPMAKAAEIAGVKNFSANTSIVGNEKILSAMNTEQYRNGIGADELSPMLSRTNEIVGHNNFPVASLENYNNGIKSLTPKPQEIKTTAIGDFLGEGHTVDQAKGLANAMGINIDGLSDAEISSKGMAIGTGKNFSDNVNKLSRYMHENNMDPNKVIGGLENTAYDKNVMISQIQTNIDKIANGPDQATIDALKSNFNEGYGDLKGANESMKKLGEKMQNQGVLTGDEIESFNKAKDVLAGYKEKIETAKEAGVDIGKEMKGIDAYNQYTGANGTGYSNYEISGAEGKQFFKKIENETKLSVADNLKKLDDVGPVANADLGGGYAEYLQKNDVKFGVEKLDNLVELSKKGVDLDDEAKSIVEAATKVKASGVGSDSSANSSLYAAVDSYSGDYAKVTKSQLSLFGDGADGSMTGTMADGKITVGQNHRDTLKGLLNEDELKDKTISKFMETGEVTSDLDLKGLNSKLIDNKKAIDETTAFNKNIDDVFNNMKDDQLDNILKNNGVDISKGSAASVVAETVSETQPIKRTPHPSPVATSTTPGYQGARNNTQNVNPAENLKKMREKKQSPLNKVVDGYSEVAERDRAAYIEAKGELDNLSNGNGKYSKEAKQARNEARKKALAAETAFSESEHTRDANKILLHGDAEEVKSTRGELAKNHEKAVQAKGGTVYSKRDDVIKAAKEEKRAKAKKIIDEGLEKLSDSFKEESTESIRSTENVEKVIEKATGSTAGMTRDEKIAAAKKIVGMGSETDSGYSYGKGFTAKVLNDEKAMNAAVDAFNDGSDTSIINAMFNVGDDKGAFRNAEQFAKKYKADPKAAMKELNERIGFAAEGNLNEKLTSKNLKEALKDVNINNHVGDGGKAILDAAEDKGGKFLNQGAKKLKNLAGKAEGDIDVKGFAEAGKEAVEAASETIKKFGGEGKEAKGVLAKAGKAISGHAGKTALMIGAGLAIGGISSAVSSAQEERQRKERELSQLMMAQSSNARGLY